MKELLTLVKKETTRIVKDKKLLAVTVLVPGISIFFMYTIMFFLYDYNLSQTQAETSIVYVNVMPSEFESFLKETDSNGDYIFYLPETDSYNVYGKEMIFIETTEGETIKNDIKEGTKDLYVEFDSDFDNKIRTSQVVLIQPYYNNMKNDSTMTYQYFMRLVEDFSNYVNPPTQTYYYDPLSAIISKGEGKSFMSSAMSGAVPLLLLIFITTGAVALGADMIAGDKEKGTLAIYLLLPIQRFKIGTSKVITLSIFSLLSTLSSFLGLYFSFVAFRFMFDLPVDMINAINFGMFFQILLLSISAAILITTLVVLISMTAKSTKEANSLLTPLIIVISLVGIALIFVDTVPTSIIPYLIPIYNVAIGIMGVFLFELTVLNLFIVLTVNIIYSIIAVIIINKMLDKEKYIFS